MGQSLTYSLFYFKYLRRGWYLKNASPPLLNSHCQTLPRYGHEKRAQFGMEEKYVVVYLPCLGRQVKYQTDEEGWHTTSFLLSFKNTKGQW